MSPRSEEEARAPSQDLTGWFEHLLDEFLPGPLQDDPEEGRRARLVVVTSLAMACIELLAVLFVDWSPQPGPGGIALPRPTVLGLLFGVVVNLGIAYSVRAARSARLARILLPASLLVTITWMALQAGGFTSPLTWWLPAITLVSASLGGTRQTLVTAVLVVADLALLYTLERMGLGPVHSEEPGLALHLRSQLVLLAFISFFAWYHESSRARRTLRLTDAYARLEATNRALRLSQLHVRQIAENIGQAIWMTDRRDGRILYVNDAYRSVFHRDPEVLRGDAEDWRRAVHPDDKARPPAEADGEDHVYRLLVDGDLRWVRHSVYPVDDENGPVQRDVHIVADTTIKRRAEALRRRFIETVLKVQENERKSLARELHDEASQSLAAMLVGLGTLSSLLQDPSQREFVQQLRNQLREVMQDLGRLARGLHPSVLDELGLVVAIGRLIDEIRDTHHLDVAFRVRGLEDEEILDMRVKLTVYRIAQEALGNVARHARADHVDVLLTMDRDETLVLRVEDDGRGFDASAAPRPGPDGGLGLFSMKERAELLGGHVEINSARGAGTTVIAEVPGDPEATDPSMVQRFILGEL